jgi:hypothetical protein
MHGANMKTGSELLGPKKYHGNLRTGKYPLEVKLC